MNKLLKQFSDRPIGILDWRRLLRHPPAQVAPEEGDQTLDPHLTNKTSAASLAGQVKRLLQPPPTACSQIQPTKGFRKSIHTCDMLLLTSSKKSWKSCPKAMPRTQTRSHMFIFGLAKMLLNELIPLPLNVSVAFYPKLDLSFKILFEKHHGQQNEMTFCPVSPSSSCHMVRMSMLSWHGKGSSQEMINSYLSDLQY